MPAVDSEHIAHVSYEPGTRVLTVEFHKGGAYQYTGVPMNRYEAMLKAPSVSAYFTHQIKGKFQTKKIH